MQVHFARRQRELGISGAGCHPTHTRGARFAIVELVRRRRLCSNHALIMDALTPLAQHSLAAALLADADPGRVFAWRAGCARNVEQFLADVAALAAHAGSQRYCVNLCEDRYRFLVAFGAAVAGRRITLLPAARTVTVVAELRTAYPDAEVISDDTVERALAAPGARATLASLIPDQAEIAIGFTSGSTATPSPHRKRWGAFKASSARLLELVASHLPEAAAPTLVATVPPQHMFGLETSVLLPLFGRVAVHAGRPLLPADIARALAEVPEPRVLVSTPLHLENLVASATRLPTVALVLCATAPLRAELAQAVEAELGTELREIFGSTAVSGRHVAAAARFDAGGGVVAAIRDAAAGRGGTAARTALRLAWAQFRHGGDRRKARLAGRPQPAPARRAGRARRLFLPARRCQRGAARRRAGGGPGARCGGNPRVPAPQRRPRVPAAAAGAGRCIAAQ